MSTLYAVLLLVCAFHGHVYAALDDQYSSQREKDVADRFWRRTHHKHSIYFWPTGGFGNMMRSLAALLEYARPYPVNIKIVLKDREGWEFAGGWYDFFRYPDLLIEPFPGGAWHPNHGAKCAIHWNGQGMPEALDKLDAWESIPGSDERVFCLVAGLTTWGVPHRNLEWVYRSMRPSAPLQQRLLDFQSAHNWDAHSWVGVHIRRRDHATQPFFQEHWKKHNISLDVKIDKQIDGNFRELPYPYWWQLERWTDAMSAVSSMSPATRHQTRFYISTDDPDTLAKVVKAFPTGIVFSADKNLNAHSRGTFEGQMDAFVDMLMLASTKMLIGTAASTFTTTAHYMGGNYLVEIGCMDAKCMEMEGPLSAQVGWHGWQ